MTSEEFLRRVRSDVERRLSELLEPAPGAPPPPARLLEALRYALLGAGKRFRPALVIASGEASMPGPPTAEVAGRLLTAACAVEMVHTFSLIHDDLPALDDDHLRRGRPTLHVRFDEATAILAGDALLSMAFEVLSRGAEASQVRLRAIGALSRSVGLDGMISGQVLDLEGEAARADGAALHRTHALKTGALITASCEMGGILAGAAEEVLEKLREYGRQLGLAFQIVDDILDVEGSPEELGKSPGKDAMANKATFPALWGLDESRRRAGECVEEACRAVAGIDRGHLAAIARGMLARKG